MSQKISVGIDIGTDRIKVVVAEDVKGEDGVYAPHIIGLGFAESKGLRHGYITNMRDATEAIRAAVSLAEKSSKMRIKKAYISVSGIGLGSVSGRGSVMISKADSEITELDVKNVLNTAESELPASALINKKIINTIPLGYKIDDELLIGRPIGMHGVRLEARALFIVCLEQHLNDLIRAVEDADVEVVDVMASILAASLVNLSKTQKVAGSVLVNIGAETTSIVVFENNIPISLEVFELGGTDITNAIALGFRIPIDEAESLKIGSVSNTEYPKKKLEDMIRGGVLDIFTLIETHLKKIGRNGLLPAGVILTGGASNIAGIEEAARASLKLPAKLAITNPNIKNQLKDNAWSVAYGLAVWGLNNGDDISSGIHLSGGRSGKLFKGAANWFKQFLP